MEKIITKNRIGLEKKILIAEAVLVAGIFIYLFFLNAPQAISPISGQIVSDPDFVFEIQNGDQVLISPNKDFGSQITLSEGDEVTLPPGTYYWKVKSLLRESEVKTFTIEGQVGLNLRTGPEKNILENSGNVDIAVKKTKGGITTNIPLEVGTSTEIENNGVYTGGQK
ncbi:MAG: hypothetical protein AABW51_04220 [Nanoarchaeota archaeon]